MQTGSDIVFCFLFAVLRTPEVARVFIGSFWNGPTTITENSEFFEADASPVDRNHGFAESRRCPTSQRFREESTTRKSPCIHYFSSA